MKKFMEENNVASDNNNSIVPCDAPVDTSNSVEQEENLYTPNCIRTVSGIYINVFDPKPEMICIEDIAHSLTYQCRFGGHLPKFYSVAQHSLNCSFLIDEPELKLAALLHDASEAYLLDIPKPIKSGLSNYKEIEDRLMKVIAERFGFEYPLNDKIKKADEQMLWVEWDYLMLGKGTWKFESHDQWKTKENFLQMFEYYSHLLNSYKNDNRSVATYVQ